MIGIIDYGLGNLKAFYNIYKENGINLKIIKNYKELNKDIDKLIFPGIGSFDSAIALLKNKNFFDEILNFATNDKNKILGICIGMQILSSGSDEGSLLGLRFIDNKFKKLDNEVLPHIGWNNIEILNNNSLFEGVPNKAFFYFLHSYCLRSTDLNHTICETEYGEKFVSGFNVKNVYGVQFHPEKSHEHGTRILLNFYKN